MTIFFATLLFYLGLVSADLPVECLRTQIHDQTWNFHVSQDKQVVNIYETKEFCSHQQPNRMQIIQKGHAFKFDKEDIWQISIKADFSAEGSFCENGNLKKCDKQKVRGSWFAIFDQVIVLKLENGLHFNANYKYEILPDVPKKLLSQIKDAHEDKKFFTSDCDGTMVGLVNNLTETSNMEEHKLECFYAKKDQKSLYEDQIGERSESILTDTALLQTEQKQKATIKQFKQRKHNLMAEHVPSDETDVKITEINKKKIGWKANTCMLQTSHPDYDHKECSHADEQISLAQTFSHKDEEKAKFIKKIVSRDKMKKSKESGKKLPKNDFPENFTKTITKVHSFRKKYKDISEIPDGVLPDTWDWRNIDGYDFTSEIYDQAACGSCYMAAMIQVLESRLKIKYAGEVNNIPRLSTQHLLECNYMNEGCSGGLFYFGGLFGNRAGLVSEECAPYLAQTKSKDCSAYKNCPVVAKIDKTYFLGEYNYKPSVAEIKKELIRNGPVNTEIFCNDEWSYYSTGIYQQSDEEYKQRDSWGNRFVETKTETEAPLLVPSEGDISFTQTEIPLQSTIQIERANLKGKKTGSERASSSQTGMATQELDHSVILVGWKMDPETNSQVWILRNSYGDKWGMGGDMYVRMGHDDFGVESEIGAYKVNLESI